MMFITPILLKDIPGDQPLKPWLSQVSGLSQAIDRHTSHYPALTLYRQGMMTISEQEKSPLANVCSNEWWCRDISLNNDQTIWSYGHTVMPQHTYQAYQETFDGLGCRLLGRDFLYQVKAQRSDFQYFKTSPGQALYEKVKADTAVDAKAYWGRYSIFTLEKGPLLLYEIMMPTLPHYND